MENAQKKSMRIWRMLERNLCAYGEYA